MYYALKFNKNQVTILDQRRLPEEENYYTYSSYLDMLAVINENKVQGIVTSELVACCGLALASQTNTAKNMNDFRKEMLHIYDQFSSTLTNTSHFLDRIKNIINNKSINSLNEVTNKIIQETENIIKDVETINEKICQNCEEFITDGDVILTMGNRGTLSQGGIGTALGAIKHAAKAGKKISVYILESRPSLKGSRYAAWELVKEGIPVTVISDNMAAFVMNHHDINKIIIGADIIAANGDILADMGSFSLSLIAHQLNIPFNVATLTGCVHEEYKTGKDYKIPENTIDEIAYFMGVQIAPEGIFVKNPTKEYVPVKYIDNIITEKKIYKNLQKNGFRFLK